jgi:hypothetical protein
VKKGKVWTVTPLDMGKAALRAIRTIKHNRRMTACEQSAGFFLAAGSNDGLQVFVKVSRFSRKLLKDWPESGGLLERLP